MLKYSVIERLKRLLRTPKKIKINFYISAVREGP